MESRTVAVSLVLNAIISFLVVASILFLLLQAHNKTQDSEVEEDSDPSGTDLLAEIRDAINANNGRLPCRTIRCTTDLLGALWFGAGSQSCSFSGQVCGRVT